MAELQLSSALEKQKWLSTTFNEYIRESGFKPYMGKSATSVIVVKNELMDEAGKTINIPLITRLKNSGVTGNGILQGNEEQLGNYNCAVSIDWRRNAVKVPKSQSYKTEIDLWSAAKDMLKAWEAEKLRDDITRAMLSVELGVNYETSTAAARNTWLTNNQDRVLYGNLKSNGSSNVHATALATVASPGMKLTAASAQLAKRMAKSADPHIRPYKTDDGREFFVYFCGARAFRDLKADTVITTANYYARAREGDAMDKNPLFQDGDLLYDGIIFRQVPEIDDIASATGILDGSGAAGADVRPGFLCGAQALAVAWGQLPTYQTDMLDDYKFRPGVAIEELLGVRKMFFADGAAGVVKQHGMVTHFSAAGADS